MDEYWGIGAKTIIIVFAVCLVIAAPTNAQQPEAEDQYPESPAGIDTPGAGAEKMDPLGELLAGNIEDEPLGFFEADQEPVDVSFKVSIGYSAALNRRIFGDRSFTHIELNGPVYNAAGGGFIHGSEILCSAVDDNGLFVGYCTVSDADGDRLHMMIQRMGTPGNSGGSDGVMMVLGGEGKYADIKGSGSFAITFEDMDIPKTHGMMIIEGIYQLP